MTNRPLVLDLPAWLWDASADLVRRSWRGGDRPVKALAALSPPAKALLRRFLERDTRTLREASVSGVAIGLELADVISIAREPAPAAGGAAFELAINPWAWEQLRRHPELVGAPRG